MTARKPKEEKPDGSDATGSELAAPLSWADIQSCIGPGGIVLFQVSAEGFRPSTHANRRKYHPRIVATLLRECNDEDEVGTVMAEQDYPDGQYLLTARTGPGRSDWWKPSGATVSIPVAVGDGRIQEVEEEDPEAAGDGAAGKRLLDQIRENDLMRQVKMSQRALEEVDGESRSRERRDAMDMFRELRETQDGRGSGVAEVLAAIVPLAIPFLERMAVKPPPDLASKAAESAISLVTASAKTQAEIASSMMKDMLETTMDMFAKIQREKLGINEEEDPIKKLLPAALQAVLPAIAGAGGEQAAVPSPTAQAGSPPAVPQGAGAPPAQQLHPAVTFVRSVISLTYARPAADVIYETSIRRMFGLLPENIRMQLLANLADEEKGAFLAFSEFASAIDPACREALAHVAQDEPAAKYLIELLSLLADDFLGGEAEEEPKPAETAHVE